MLEVILRNDGARSVEIVSFQLRGGAFTQQPPTPRVTVLEPGQRRDVPLPYGAVRCGGPAPEQPSVVARTRAASGVGDVTLRLPADEVLADLRADECAQRAVLRGVAVGFGPSWQPTRDPTTARGVLVLRRQASHDVITVDGPNDNVIFSVTAIEGGGTPRERLPAAAQTATVPIEIRASRCDPHALADIKKPFHFSLWVSLGSAEAQYLEIDAKGEGREVLNDLMAGCAP